MRNRIQKNVSRTKLHADRAHDECVSHWMRHDKCGPNCPVNVRLKAVLAQKCEAYGDAAQAEMERRRRVA